MNRVETLTYSVLPDKCEGNGQLVDGYPMDFGPWSYTRVSLHIGMYGDSFLIY